ncbi:MAG: hypothetical protein WBQ25_20850 [Nitrososphaeraceae archaeon]
MYTEKSTTAIEWFDKAISIDPNYGKAWGSKGRALAYPSRYEEALRAYDTALAFDHNSMSARFKT